jgi:hypothetical protein
VHYGTEIRARRRELPGAGESATSIRRVFRSAKGNVNHIARHENEIVIDDRFGGVSVSLSNDLYCSLDVLFDSAQKR